MRWLSYFAALNIGFFAAIMGVVWLAGGFDEGGLGVAGTTVMLLGLFFTMGLATALMGLIFYSNREDVDDAVHHLAEVPKHKRRG